MNGKKLLSLLLFLTLTVGSMEGPLLAASPNAAETVADGASEETAAEETTEAVAEDAESATPAESDLSETSGAEASLQNDSEALEEVADVESDADDKAVAEDKETETSETAKVNDEADASQIRDAGDDTEIPAFAGSTKAAEEVAFSAGKLEFNGENYGKDYSVTLSFDADAGIPSDARLQVTEIEKDKDPERYEAYLKEANAAVENSVTDARFFDIKIMVGDEEIQPKSAVKVNISYKKAIEVEEKAEVQAVHFDEKKDEPVPVKIETNDGDKVDEVAFKAETFSVYAVLYTVDFNFTDYAFSIPGGSSILLSVVAQKLGFYAESETKEFSVRDVVNVTFTSEDLIITKKQEDGDWLLTSLKAFSTQEKLTIEMADGDKFVVDVTDAQDALTIKTSLYDYDDTTAVAFPGDFCADNVYAFVYVNSGGTEFKDLPDNTPWAVVNLNDIKGSNSPFTVEVNSFNTSSWGGNIVSYSSLTDEQKQNLKVRVIHTSDQPSLGGLKNKAKYQQSEYEQLWNGGFEGYAMSTAHPSEMVSEGNYEVNFIKGNTQEHDVTIEFNPASDKGAIPAGKYYVLLDATSADGNNHYNYVVEVSTDGSTDKVNFPITGNWSSGQPFSNNWKNITATVITPKAGKTITPGGNKPDTGDYDVSYMMGDYLSTYKERRTEIDEVKHIQHDEFVFELKNPNFESAIDPYDVLGEGAEYGVIADVYERKEHTETNFAVNTYIESTNAGIDLAANGGESEAMPFYVGEYDHIRFTGNTTVNPDIYTPSSRSDSYVHSKDNSDESEDHIHQDGTGYDVTVIPTSKSDVNTYVSGLIDKLTTSSETYAKKNSIKAPAGRVLDTTSLPDNVTIYVDASDLNISDAGWEIKKLEGQSIVINKPGSSVNIEQEYVSVYKKGEDGSLTLVRRLSSNTGGNGGNKEYNDAVEKYILNHIVINAYEASSVTFKSGPAGLFLAPKANVEEVNGSGTGWVATGMKFTQTGSEWHFFRTQRKYKANGDIKLSGKKKVVDSNGTEKDYSKFSSLTFKFELYECDENGNAEEGAKALDTATAGSDGTFSFNKLKYSQAQVPLGTTKTFYYVIREDKTATDNDKGVIYDAADVYVKVVATDNQSGKISFVISKGEPGSWTEIEPAGKGDNQTYEIGDFKNTIKYGSLKVKKFVNGDNAKKDQYEIAVKNGAGHYFDVDGTDKDTAPFYVTFAKDQEQTWINLPAGTYTVEEKDASESDYTWTSSGTRNAVVEAGQTATADVTNIYVKHTEAEIKAEKNFTGRSWKYTDSFEFILKPVGNAPMPSDAETTEDGKQKKITARTAAAVSFGTIPYTEAGTYNYTITETKGNLPGVTYDTTPHAVTVTVNEDDNKHLTATVTYDKGTDAQEITNTFEAVTEHFEATKEIENWGNAESFTFTLAVRTPADAPMPASDTATVTKGGSMVAVFGDITYEAPGTYVYAINETDDHVPGITYDVSDHIVTVVVSQDNGTNKLSATVTYGTGEDTASSLTITNTFEKAEATLEATKSINDWGSAESFTFTLAPVDGAPMPDGAATMEKTVTKGGNLKAIFGTIEYDRVGEYEYTITETDGGVPGVTYDTTPHKVIVNVHKAADSNDLVADVTYDGEKNLTIVNSYASTELALQAEKSINEWGDATSFTFKLEAGKSLVKGVEGTSPMPASDTATAVRENTIALFDSVNYEEAGTYNYTITEVDDHVAGITYDTTPHKAVVTVEKNADGDLTASAKYDDNKSSLTITNTFTSLKKQLEATKSIEDWGRATSFTFKLAAVTDGAPMPASDTATVTKGGSMKAVFGEIEYKTTGEYDYTITEENDGVDGVTYDTIPHPVHVSVTKNETTNALEATITYGKGEEAGESLTITNTFTAVEAELKAAKDFNDWGKATSFTFDLAAVSATDAEGKAISPIPVPDSMTATATEAARAASFGKIKYDKAGTYEYTITEQNGGADGVSYDVTPHSATVVVTKDEQTNELSAEVTYDGEKELIITNTFTAAIAHVEAAKVLENRGWFNADEFEFELAAVTEGAPMPTSKTAKATKEEPVAVFGDMEFVKAGTYLYTITEKDGGIEGITYDTKPHGVTVTVSKADDKTNKLTAEVAYDGKDELEITNTYASEGDITLKVKKELKGRNIALDAGAFEFQLMDEAGNVLQTAKNDALGNVEFDKITYTQDDIYEVDDDGVYSGSDTKEFTYRIREVIPEGAVDNKDGTFFFECYTYDATVYELTVIAKDNGDGTIDAKVAGSEDEPGDTGVVFTNAYDADGTVKLNAEKIYKKGTLHGGEFTFELRDADGNVLQSKKNDAAGNVSFDMITYKLADAANAPFTYTVREVSGSRTDVKYDATVYTVSVNLEDNGDGTLKVTKKISGGGALKFVNKQLNVETSVNIGGVKVLEGGTLKNGQFKFVLEDADGKRVDTATNDADGNFTFKPIAYKLSDLNGEKSKVFTYSVREMKGHKSGITYDQTVYTVVVTVTDNRDGTMIAKADLAKSDIKFVNKAEKKKNKKKGSTRTGDEAPLGVMFGGLVFSAAGLAVLLEDRKRRNRNR